MRVLVVEDDTALREVIADELRDHGYTVDEADSARTAIMGPVRATPPDILVTDTVLTGEADGYDVALYWRSKIRDLPIIYASGRDALDPSRTLPASAFLRKPFRVADLVRQIERLAALRAEPIESGDAEAARSEPRQVGL